MKILYAEDDLAHVALTERALEEAFQRGFILLHAETISSAMALLEAHPDVDLILSDLRLPDGSGLDLLKQVKLRMPLAPVVLVTGQGDQENAVAALKGGATDYIVKQSDYLLRLPVAINNAIAQNRLTREQTALREAEVKYQTLVEQTPAVVFLDKADENETGIYMSPRVEELTGYAPSEWLADAQLWDGIIHEEDRSRIREAYQTSHKSGSSFLEEYRIVRRDGKIIWVKEHTHLIKDEKANPLYWQGIIVDITKEREIQAALQSERDFALQILNTMAQGLTLTNEEGKFEYVNPAYARMIGRTQEEIIGKKPSDFTDPTALEPLTNEIESRRKGYTSAYESLLIHQQGHTVPVIISGAPRYKDSGRRGAIAVVTDLTAIKKAEVSLARQVKELTILQMASAAETEIASSENVLIEKITGIIHQVYKEVCGILLLDASGEVLIPHPSYCGAEVSNWEKGYTIAQGITGKCVRLGTAIRVGNVQEEATYIAIADGIQSELCVPIRVNEKIIGVLNVESKSSNVFDDGDERFLVTLADGLGSAIERIRLHNAQQRRVRELEIINRVSTYLRTAQTLEDMLAILLGETMNVIETNHGAIWLYSQSDNLLVQRIAKGAEERIPQKILRPSEGIIGLTFSSGKNYISREVREDPLTHEGNRQSIQPGLGCVAIPVQSIAGPVGVLSIFIDSKRQITTEELNLLTIFAEITGNAIHRAELFEQGQEQIRRLTTLRDIDSAIASSTDLRVILNILTEHAVRQLKVDAVDVLLYRPEIQSLSHIISAGFRNPSPTRPLVRIGEGLAGKVLMKGRIDHITDLKNSAEARRDPLIAREGFVTYIGVPLIVKGQIKGVFEAFHRSPLQVNADWMQFLQTLAGQAAIAIDSAHLFDNLQKTNQELTQAYDTTLEGWARALELRDRETEGHTRRVTDLTLMLAKRMGIKDDELVNMYRGVLLHDIGKMGVPDQILKKTGPLNEPEWDEMRRHPQYAYDLLSPIEFLRPALDIPYCHHEHWDGSGYPNRLKGDQIPLAARIFSVVDVWDALLSDRPYRNAWPRQRVAEYIRNNAGIIFDPKVVEIFLAMMTREE
jgi:PAS domain S-box-containing protein